MGDIEKSSVTIRLVVPRDPGRGRRLPLDLSGGCHPTNNFRRALWIGGKTSPVEVR